MTDRRHGKKNILVFPKPAIGDILLATPLLAAIRRSEPEARIEVMCYPGQQGILEGNPDVDGIVPMPQKPSFRELLTTTRELWRKYDVMITNAADDRVHLYLLLFGRRRISVLLETSASWKRWITHANVIEGREGLHALLRNNRLGDLLGYSSDCRVRVPSLARPEDADPPLARVLAGDRPLAVVHPDARLPYKRWTPDGWAAVFGFLLDRGLTVCVTGGTGQDEKRYVDELLRDSPEAVVNLAGQVRFAEVAGLLRRSRIYVGVDTVTSHIAAAAGTPTIALFGPERATRWGPWPAGHAADRVPWADSGTQRCGNVTIIQAETRCPTCGPGDCRRRRGRGTGCSLMLGITSTQVIDCIREILK